MPTTEASPMAVSPNELYRKVVKKISSQQETYKDRIKSTIQNKYQRHISLLESHLMRKNRFQNNEIALNKLNEERNDQLRIQFKDKEKTIKHSRMKFISQKKRKLQSSFIQWQNVQFQHQKKHLNALQQSEYLIKKWNTKCEESQQKKRLRLKTISSTLIERSRILSQKNAKHQEKQLQKLLQKVLLNNPQNTKRNEKTPENSRISSRLSSRISSRIKATDINKISLLKRNEEDSLYKDLQKYVKKQAHIKEVRNKKSDLISSAKKVRENRSLYLDQIHKNNNQYLNSKRMEMQEKLNTKFSSKRAMNKKNNRSLPSIKYCTNQVRQNNKNDREKTSKKMNKRASTIDPHLDKIILDQLRNISLNQKMKNLKP